MHLSDSIPCDTPMPSISPELVTQASAPALLPVTLPGSNPGVIFFHFLVVFTHRMSSLF
jgi:hypothetical protein